MVIKGFLSSKQARYAVYGLLAIVSVWTLWNVVARIRAENANDTVEICVDLDQVIDLCHSNNYPVEDFLERCQAIGASSAALREETASSLAMGRRAVYFSEADFGRLNILDLISYGSDVKPGSILVPDKNLADAVAAQLKERYNLTVKQRRVGKYRILYPEFPSGFAPSFWGADLPLGFAPDKINFILKTGLKPVLRPVDSGNPQWLAVYASTAVSGFIWEGKEIPGYPGREDILRAALLQNGVKYVDMEFNYVIGTEKLKSRLPHQSVRGHTISPQELARNYSASGWIARWERAVRDRGIRFVYFQLWENRPIEANIDYLRELARSLKKDGFKLGNAEPPVYPDRLFRPLWMFFTAAAGILFPLIGLYVSKKQHNPFKAYLVCNAFTLAGGLLISAFLFDTAFMQKLADVQGVKVIMLLPIFLSFLIVFPPQEIAAAMSFKIQLKHVLLVFGVLLGVVLLLLRSGNYNALTSSPEFFFRDSLEWLFGYRPRTKEFLFGQPLLFLGFVYRKPWLLILGMVGQVSLINTFLHAHSPVVASLSRSAHGIWIGLLIGYAAYFIAGKVLKYKK